MSCVALVLSGLLLANYPRVSHAEAQNSALGARLHRPWRKTRQWGII